MKDSRPIIFLHLPKCAGQSIRTFLMSTFPKRLVFPGQLDQHLALYSCSDLRQYDIFSGHFSWSLLDFLGPEALIFTVIRNPVDRIVSFYKFLRRTADALSRDDLLKPNNRVIRIAAEHAFENFLTQQDREIKNYILANFDNFYMYYFATRLYNGRHLIRDNSPESDYFTTENILNIAIRNIRDRLRVYDSTKLHSLVSDLKLEPGYVEHKIPHVNVAPNSEVTSQQDSLISISQDLHAAQEQLHLRCQFDMRIYNTFCT